MRTTRLLQTGRASSSAAHGTDQTVSQPGHFVPFMCIVASLASMLLELPELSASSKNLASPPPPSLPCLSLRNPKERRPFL